MSDETLQFGDEEYDIDFDVREVDDEELRAVFILDALLEGSEWAGERGLDELSREFGRLYQQFGMEAIGDGE